MKRILFILPFLFLFASSAFSQVVVATQGGICKDTNASVEWTVGEPVIETFSSSQNIVTQGFHQPGLIVVAIEENVLETSLNVFPNPVNEQLTIKNNGEVNKVIFIIFDINGRKMMNGDFTDNTMVVDVSSLPNCVYLLQLFDENNKKLKTFKVQKTK